MRKDVKIRISPRGPVTLFLPPRPTSESELQSVQIHDGRLVLATKYGELARREWSFVARLRSIQDTLVDVHAGGCS